MQLYKFFNSTAGDPRTYQAADFADYFGSVLSTGFLHTNNVPGMRATVIPGTLRTSVTAGKAIMEGHMYENTDTIELTHALPETTADRIDRVVLRLNLENDERNILLHVVKGTPSGNPVAPALRRDNFVYEISLARIRVRANTVQLLPADLVDERLIAEFGGLVSSLISIPIDQFQEQWDNLMLSIQSEGFTPMGTFNTHTNSYVKHPAYGKTTNSGNVFTISLNPVPGSYVDGLGIVFTANASSTAAATLNVNGMGAKPIRKASGSPMTNLRADGIYTVRYNSTQGAFILQGEGGSGTAQPNDVARGKTFANDDGDQVGTLTKIFAEAGNISVNANSSSIMLSNRTPALAKQTIVKIPGMYRVTYTTGSQNPDGGIYSQLYRNGQPIGIQRFTSGYNAGRTYTEDIALESGDAIQIYAWADMYGVYISNFILQINEPLFQNS